MKQNCVENDVTVYAVLRKKKSNIIDEQYEIEPLGCFKNNITAVEIANAYKRAYSEDKNTIDVYVRPIGTFPSNINGIRIHGARFDV